MLEVMSIKLDSKRRNSADDKELTPPRLFRSFQEANQYLSTLQSLNEKGQFTDVSVIIRWESATNYYLLPVMIRIDFRNAYLVINLIDYAIRFAVSQVEQKRDPYYAKLLKQCYIGDNYRESLKR